MSTSWSRASTRDRDHGWAPRHRFVWTNDAFIWFSYKTSTRCPTYARGNPKLTPVSWMSQVAVYILVWPIWRKKQSLTQKKNNLMSIAHLNPEEILATTVNKKIIYLFIKSFLWVQMQFLFIKLFLFILEWFRLLIHCCRVYLFRVWMNI